MSGMVTMEQLQSQIKGRVIEPGHAEYDDARKVFVGGVDRRPALIVRVADADDVAHTIDLARETGRELAVRSGGHSGLGHGTTEGGIVIDLREMRSVTIDADDRTAWAETGLRARDYSVAAQAHGLATGFGDTGSVGIGGLTLGGGVGYLSRKYGLTIDDLLAAEVVTADGTVVTTDANNHPDLFWAIRGGGGNFGVATRFKLRLHELDKVFGGMLILPATADVVEGFVAAAESAPEEVGVIGNVMPAPPMPFIPAEFHGRMVILAFMVHSGALDAGERSLGAFRSLTRPLADMLRPMPYLEIYPPEDPNYRPKAKSRTMFVKSLDRPRNEVMLERLNASTASVRAVQIRILGGAIDRVPVDATAYAHRQRRMLLNIATFYETADDAPVRQAWVDDLWHRLQDGTPGAYVNFLGDEGMARVREAY